MKVIYWSDDYSIDKDNIFQLKERYGHLGSEDLLKVFIKEEFPEQLALVSSFGIEAPILLKMVSDIDKSLPIVFIDTGKLFEETLSYRDDLVEILGLKDVRTIQPKEIELMQDDPNGDLWKVDQDSCCQVRKVKPLQKTLDGFTGWITGRKRFHGAGRQNLSTIEMSNGQLKLNPLAYWKQEDVLNFFSECGLPRHPLFQAGYYSIGCEPCTAKATCISSPRSGRWSGLDKTECGIHTGLNVSVNK